MSGERVADRLVQCVIDAAAMEAMEHGHSMDLNDPDQRVTAEYFALAMLTAIKPLADVAGVASQWDEVLEGFIQYWDSHGGNRERQQ